MNAQSAKVLLAALAAALALGMMLFVIRWTASPRPEVSPGLLADPGPVDAAVTLEAPNTETVDYLLSTFEKTLREALARAGPDGTLAGAAGEQFVQLAVLRLRLMATGDREADQQYRARIGAPPRDEKSRQMWDWSIRDFVEAGYDPSIVYVERMWSQGKEAPYEWLGLEMYIKDDGTYSEVDQDAPKSDVVRVRLPAEVSDMLTKARTRAWVTLYFAWSPKAREWRPWRAGVADPRGEARLFVPPF